MKYTFLQQLLIYGCAVVGAILCMLLASTICVVSHITVGQRGIIAGTGIVAFLGISRWMKALLHKRNR